MIGVIAVVGAQRFEYQHPLDPLEIEIRALEAPEARIGHGLHSRGLMVSHLDDHPPVYTEISRNIAEQLSIKIETIFSTEQRQLRFIFPNLRGERIAFAARNVRRIRDDDVDVVLRR